MLVPKNQDEAYGSDMVSQTLFDVRDVRALFGDTGDVMVWSQALMHWGGRGSAFADRPRVSMSMGMQLCRLAPFNSPLLKPDVLPSIGLRLEMIAKQLLQYEQAGKVGSAWCHFARVLLASGLSGLTYDLPIEWRL